MSRPDRCCPFERCSAPGVFGRLFFTFPNAIEKVDYKQYLQGKNNDCGNRNEFIQIGKMRKSIESFKTVISARNSSHTQIVHRPENGISADECSPEMYLAQGLIHKPAVHLRKPVVNSCKHPEERGNTHHYMEMRNDEIGVVHLDLNS